jgi:serine phosphatase RsbU (regulator of sigma subunit)
LWAGIVPTAPPGSVPDSECRLHPGDVLLLYTDGLTESRNAEMGVFGVERLCESLVGVAHRPTAEILDHILGRLGTWATRQKDDLTLVVLRYQGAL